MTDSATAAVSLVSITTSSGVLSPADSVNGRRDEWNVAIRTVWIDRPAGRATYGVGGGIVWDSDPSDEWDETRVKSRVLLEADQAVSLIESFRFDPDDTSLGADNGFWLLDEHLERLEQSADFFEFTYDSEELRAQLLRFTSDDACKLRAVLHRDGNLHLSPQPLGATGRFDVRPFGPDGTNRPGLEVIAAIDSSPVRADNPFLLHKTTNRTVYADALKRHPEADDVILIGDHDNVTESTCANVVIQNSSGLFLTPPTTDGLLAGVFRQYLLTRGHLIEEPLSIADVILASAENRAWLINSVRGWMTLSTAS